MKNLFLYLKKFVKEDFNFWHYLFILVFLSVALFTNYYLGFNKFLIKKDFGAISRIVFLFIFFAIPYFFSLLSFSFFNRDFSIFKSKRNLIVFFSILLVISFNASSLLLFKLSTLISMPSELKILFYKCMINISYSLIFGISLVIFRYTIDLNLPNFFGLTFKSVYWRMYFSLLDLSVLIVLLISLHPDFLNFYPTYRAGLANKYLGIHPAFTISIYELSYGIQFFFVELFFRGFLVIGMVKLLGRSAVISMVCLYVFWHFGKPPLEAISSIFGGYILGVLAYYTKNIWGGILLHVGLAWTMDISTIIQKGMF